MDEFSSFHDWYIDRVEISDSKLMLSLHFYEKRTEICFFGVVRCLINNFLMQNVIYEVKLVSINRESGLFLSSRKQLEQAYPTPKPGESTNIAIFTPSVGADILIEFNDLKITLV
jgi:hypothetical protein